MVLTSLLILSLLIMELLIKEVKKDGDFDDKDLAEIPPLKANLGLNYQYQKNLNLKQKL